MGKKTTRSVSIRIPKKIGTKAIRTIVKPTVFYDAVEETDTIRLLGVCTRDEQAKEKIKISVVPKDSFPGTRVLHYSETFKVIKTNG